MSVESQGEGWWLASDGKWYPPESRTQSAPPMATIGKARSKGLTILLVIVTLGIWSYVWSYANGDELKRYRRSGLGGAVYLVLAIVPIASIVVMFLMADEVGKLYSEAGEEPPITATWGLWFLLPLIGNIVWYVRIQNSINNFWIARGAAPATGV